jgi:two-component sensor histidine kinase
MAKRVPPAIGYPVAVAAVVVALIIRMTVLNVVPYCAFITIYPTIVAVSVLLGLGPGLLATALSAAAFYLDPAGLDRPITSWELVTLAGFVATAVSICVLMEWLRDAFRSLVAQRSALQAANERAATLYRELDHRVRNSLHLAGVMLSVQAGSNRGLPEVKAALDDAAARVRAIALIHEFLAVSSDLKEIELDRYLAKLCGELTEHTALRCTVELEPIRMATERASILAMIAHELITNAAKYAYPGAGGPVTVSCRREPDGMIRLTIADTGVGLPETVQPDAGGGLGMRIIRSLVAQLAGRLEIAHQAGTKISVVVPANATPAAS